MMFGTMEYYDKMATEWAERGYAQEAEVECLRDFLSMLPEGARVLDLCCGAGYESRRIADLGYEAVGIDFSEESIKIARQKNPSISFYQEDMLCDYSYTGTVDAIIVIAGLVHIETTKLPLAFEQMRKVLKKGGKLLVSVNEGIGKIEDRSLCEIEGMQYDRNFIAHTL
ncbi:MAG: class I SAM-dependent methyltransferase, partial [Lachnospiraceae bacterium]|nr:class I SAM-dependent methyltransferase [Lachnospiraceae bacterium]